MLTTALPLESVSLSLGIITSKLFEGRGANDTGLLKQRVHGDVESPILVLEEGGTFEGRCRMPKPDVAVLPLERS